VQATILPSKEKISSNGEWKVVERNSAKSMTQVVAHDFHNEDVGSKGISELLEIHHCVSSLSLPHICIYFEYLVLPLVSTWLFIFVTIGTI
jgi:hypothetical protein